MGIGDEVEKILNSRLKEIALGRRSPDPCKPVPSKMAFQGYLRRLLLDNPWCYSDQPQTESSTAHLIPKEIVGTLRRPPRMDDFATAILGGEGEIYHNFDISQFIAKNKIDDVQAAMLAVSLLCQAHEIKADIVKELMPRFSALLRHMGNAREEFTTDEVVLLARHLLMNDNCTKVLTAVQKFVVEYALFQRYQSDLPREVKLFFSDYNRLRVTEDESKSLAQLFDETRGAATNTVSAINMIFNRRNIKSSTDDLETQITELIVTIVNSAYPAGSWNGEKLGKCIYSRAPDLDWSKVIRGLDREDLEVANLDDLKLLLSIMKGPITTGKADVPIHFLWGVWRHTRAQASLLRQLTAAPLSIFNITDYKGPKVLSADDFVSAPATLKNLAAQLETSSWNSLELLETSLRLLADEEAAQDTKYFLEAAGKMTPELIFLGCVQLPHPWGPQQEQLSEKGFEVFFGGQPNHQLVFFRLWQVNAEFLCQKLVEYHTKNTLNINRVLDIADELHILDQLLNLQPLFFAIDLAALAARREFLHIEKWLDHHISTGQDTFIEACLKFLSYKAEAENTLQQSNGSSTSTTVALRVETVAIFLKALMNTAMSPENGESLKQVQSACLQVYPRLMNSTNANRESSESNNFAKDVEKEVEFYYGRLYEGDMSISNFVGMLQNLKQSSDPRDQDIFACMLHSLFDEYRFFADYPLSALNITAVLFGSLIQNQLLSYIPLGIALRYILDAVGHDPGSNMFKFGVQALTHFKDRVPSWPQYCQQVLAVSTLVENEPDLVALIRDNDKRNTKGRYDSEEPVMSVTTPRERQMTTKAPFHSLQPTQRDEARYTEPAIEISDKILFNINNMSLTNLSEKLSEVKSVLQEQYFSWFAIHLVSQRAAVEPNYHSLYIHFLEAMQDDDLLQRIVQETIENISLLLNSDNTITSTVERTNLKNLGSWLGGLTLARNKPLKHKMISLKDLLLEGFDGNRLIVVLPFVCRVLEQTVNSRVFKPPCPWTMGILGLLMELYETAEMKLNLKFEVEVLCKKLDLRMSDVPSTSVLRNRPYIPEVSGYHLEGLEEVNMRPESTRRSALDSHVDHSTAFVTDAIAEMSITIHPVIQQNFAVPNLRRLLLAAAERAIREFILPVVERSVAIASISTSQLVSKDFAFEEDLSKFRRAAHTMNQNLAGSLALVTCKEPLRVAFAANLRVLLAQCGFEGLSAEGETLLNQLVGDNLDAACMVVEKAATDRAISEIDDGLAGGYQARRKHLDAKNGQKFADSSAPRHAFPLPSPLRLRSSGLTPEQMSTYDDFARIPRTAHEAALYYAKEELRTTPAELESPIYRSEQQSSTAFEQLLSSLSDVDSLARDSSALSMDDLGPDSGLRSALQQIPLYLIALTGTVRDERTLTASQRVCQLLFKVPYDELAAQCLTFLLNSFVELSMKTFRDVSVWLVHSEDTRKFNVPVIETLIRAQIIVPSEFDVQLAKQISMHKPTAIDFAIGLISEAVLGPSPVALRTDFTSTLDALDSLSQVESIAGIYELFSQLQSTQNRLLAETSDDYSFEDILIKEQISLIFMEWVHLISHPATTEKTQLAYLLQLQKSGIIADDNLASLFFRCIIEQSIESALRMMPVAQSESTAHYLVIDAAAKLVVLLLMYANAQDQESSLNNFRRILSIIVMVFVHEHDLGRSTFNQKPFFRFYASLLSEIHAHSNPLGSLSPRLLGIVSDSLVLLQPQHYPGFTFSWMTLISHRLFMPKILAANEEENWPKYSELVCALLKSLAPSLQSTELSDKTRVLYHATLRMLLVLLNDFPSFLDEMSYNFMNIIPDGCVQLRNLILSSFPRNMLLPDPFTPGLKVDRLPETANAPRIWADLEQVLSAGKVLNHVHNYIYSLNPTMLQKIVKALVKDKENSDAPAPDAVLLNTLVLHCGVQAMGSGSSPPVFEVNSPWVSLLHELFKILNPIGRYRMLGAIANQLRYPNSHTYFFSCVLLLLFSTGGESDALVKEQIMRVLLERLICNRPHPWGLLITFTELLKNSKYGFWDLKFVRNTKEVETLFLSLADHINKANGEKQTTSKPAMLTGDSNSFE